MEVRAVFGLNNFKAIWCGQNRWHPVAIILRQGGNASIFAGKCNHASKKSNKVRPTMITGIQIKEPDVLRMDRSAFSREAIEKRKYCMANHFHIIFPDQDRNRIEQ
jgi:hypothetical protein